MTTVSQEAREAEVMQWRKKPVVITAVQINTQQDAELCPGICTGGPSCKSKGAPDDAWPHIHTLEGDHTWTPGDWCITGVKGERYFCKPDIFEQTYEPAHRQSAERAFEERERKLREAATALVAALESDKHYFGDEYNALRQALKETPDAQ